MDRLFVGGSFVRAADGAAQLPVTNQWTKGYHEGGSVRKDLGMGLRCNIDQKGAAARRVWGIMSLGAAVILGGLAWWSGIWWLWVIAGAGAGMGLLALYEAKRKWCVMRAMGIKTKM